MTTKTKPAHGTNVDGQAATGTAVRAEPCQPKDTTGSTARQTRIVLYNDRGKHTASIVGDVLCKSVHGSRHMFTRPFRAWAFDVEHIRQAQAKGVNVVIVTDLDDNATYKIGLDTFLAAAERVQFGDNGPQLRVGLGWFHCERDDNDDDDASGQMRLPL